MKKIILSLFAFLIYSCPAFSAMCNPADNIYNYLVPGCIRQDESYIATGTGSDVCVSAAKICSGAQIANANLATLTTAGLVNGSSITSLSSVPSGAGALGIISGGTGQTSRQAALNALAATSLSGTTGEDIVSNGTNMVLGYPGGLTIPSMAQGDILFVNSTPAVSRLAAGTSGYFLETQGASANPTWAQVTQYTPPSGLVQMWGGNQSTIPSGWLLCNGQAVSRTTYSSLFTAIGTIYGSGNGTTTFNVPNLSNVTVVGADNDVSTIPNSSITGSESTSSSTGQLPSTTVNSSGTVTSGNSGGTGFVYGTGGHGNNQTINVSGSFGTGSNVVPPYQAMYYIIKT